MTTTRAESNDTYSWYVRIETINGIQIIGSRPSTYIELQRPEIIPQFGNGHDVTPMVFDQKIIVGFLAEDISNFEIDQCQEAPLCNIFVYPREDSLSYVSVNGARCYSYMIDPNGLNSQIELHWSYRSTTVHGMDWDQFTEEANHIPKKHIRWQEAGF
jgi:hypothetical protein